MNGEPVIAFRLLKDAIEAPKGTIYTCRARDLAQARGGYFRATPNTSQAIPDLNGQHVVDNKQWFEEVFLITPLWATAKELKAMEKKEAKK